MAIYYCGFKHDAYGIQPAGHKSNPITMPAGSSADLSKPLTVLFYLS